MGCALVERAVRRGRRVLWIAHRSELIHQPARALREADLAVGLVHPSEQPSPLAAVQVASVQSLLARDARPEADLLVLDEAHHYAAAEWRTVLEAYPRAAILGLTATPERADGAAMGDLFSALIVAAHYSELQAAGHLVPCRVMVPVTALEQGQIADLPLTLYQQHGEGRTGFLFCSTIEQAESQARQFSSAGIGAVCISERTPASERGAALKGLAHGVIRILTNVYALTEGVDVPSASICILARGVGHVSPYLQMVGRVLRPAPGKTDAILLDLHGSANIHGHPCHDRDYSLDTGITPSPRSPGLRQCVSCGFCWEGVERACPRCGYAEALTPDSAARLALAGVALRELDVEQYQVERAMLRQLRERQRAAGYGLYWVVARYKQVTGEAPTIKDATMDEKREEYARLVRVATEKGWKEGAIAHMYRRTFGVWPKGVDE